MRFLLDLIAIFQHGERSAPKGNQSTRYGFYAQIMVWKLQRTIILDRISFEISYKSVINNLTPSTSIKTFSWQHGIRELKQPQKPHKFAYLTMKNSIFARFARAFFIFWHFADVLVLSTTWNDMFYSCVDDVSIWWQMFNFILLCSKCWFQFNSRIVWTHFSGIMSLNNWKMIAETRSHIFRLRFRFRRRRVCLSSHERIWK